MPVPKIRDEFTAIVGGWALIDGMEDITDRIERAGKWARENGPLWPHEQATIELMIRTQIARGIEQGDFDDIFPRSMMRSIMRGEKR